MRGGKQMIKLSILKHHLQESLILLKQSFDKEKIILWLGEEKTDTYMVTEVFVPIQITDRDYFTIPPEGMNELLRKLKTTRSMLVAQVHTHPFEAFHSLADDKWAILRHLNAYSLVLPWFGATTNVANFKSQVASFILTHLNKWEKADNNNLLIL
jgi:hypothetical protein